MEGMTAAETAPAADAPTDALLRTPLHDAHRKAGARLVPFAGWEMPVQYAGVLPEVKAVRESVGIFDVSHMGRVRVEGRRAADYLQFLTVNDVSKLPAAGGSAQYSLLCADDGTIIDDIIVYRLEADEFIVVVNASNRDKDLAWMRAHLAKFDHVTLVDETHETALIAVQGPKAMTLMDALSDRDLSALPRFGLDETVVAGVQAMAARTGYTGEDGVELFCKAEHARALWQELCDKGATPCGLGARDTLRLEAALPLYGHEMDARTQPYEARLGWVVKTDKPGGEFVGGRALKELKDAPKRHVLVGIEMEGRAIPREGYPLLAAGPSGSGDPVGHVTSGTFSPMRQKGVAMARVTAEHAAKGTSLDVLIREARHPARVVPLPFYKNV
jgi:aminomethyltransferase